MTKTRIPRRANAVTIEMKVVDNIRLRASSSRATGIRRFYSLVAQVKVKREYWGRSLPKKANRATRSPDLTIVEPIMTVTTHTKAIKNPKF
jgi:hypothetical protein